MVCVLYVHKAGKPTKAVVFSYYVMVGLGVTVTYVHMTVLKAAYWVIASPMSQQDMLTNYASGFLL